MTFFDVEEGYIDTSFKDRKVIVELLKQGPSKSWQWKTQICHRSCVKITHLSDWSELATDYQSQKSWSCCAEKMANGTEKKKILSSKNS